MKASTNRITCFTIACLIQILLYVTHYLLIPLVYHPVLYDDYTSAFLLGISTIIFVIIGQAFLMKRLVSWLLSFPIYPILVWIYHPSEIYGIGAAGYYALVKNEDLDIIIWSLFILIVEIITAAIIKLIRQHTNWNK